MTEPTHEVALTPDEVREIFARCGPHALLVGGQALALWAAVYEVTPPKVLAASISSVADFIGNAALARELGDALMGWDFWKPTLEEGASLREVLDAIERIGQIATNKRLTGVVLDYEIDILSAVPTERVAHAGFRMKRWPQITQLVEERQRKYQQQRARRAKPRMR